MDKSITIKPSHVPEGAWRFFCEIDPNRASIKGKPFKLWPEFKQRNLKQYINSFGEMMCGQSSIDLWNFWIKNYAPDGEINGMKSEKFAEALFFSCGSMKEFRNKISDEKKNKTKKSIEGHIQKLVGLIENTECIVGLRTYSKENNLLPILNDFQKFMATAKYGVDGNLSATALGQAQAAALERRKTVSHIDFQRVFGRVLMSDLNYTHDKNLETLITLAQVCMFPDVEMPSVESIRLNVRPQKQKCSREKNLLIDTR